MHYFKRHSMNHLNITNLHLLQSQVAHCGEDTETAEEACQSVDGDNNLEKSGKFLKVKDLVFVAVSGVMSGH